ncbi:superoxide dismutase [Deinococcus detaillensis]|uniref:Superoxide dismutase n=1 Tax=Deinococcus detaillensis TaxID=2592048 RepID=A0A553UNB7_9DEIO|nr:superoxide dismutase [Deinococcus detaillensis]TSA81712.1 superoxide dismutase [Deinococcus detaillensis]
MFSLNVVLRRTSFALLTLGLLGIPGTMSAQKTAVSEMISYSLPGNSVFPEGVAHQAGSQNFYVSSTTDGTIFKGTLGKANAEVMLPPVPERPSVLGMKVDEGGWLYMAGGTSGKIFVYDTATKAPIKAFDTPEAPERFINDVALSADAAYFTDSARPILFRVSRTANSVGEIEAWLDLSTTAVKYLPFGPGSAPNLNGIVVTPGGQYLIVVQSNTGKLYRITIADKTVKEIDLGGIEVHGDGLLFNGPTLYAVADSSIVPITLSADFSSGKLGVALTDDRLRFPTTIAQVGDRLLVVNSQFDKQGSGLTPEVPFTVLSVTIPK